MCIYIYIYMSEHRERTILFFLGRIAHFETPIPKGQRIEMWSFREQKPAGERSFPEGKPLDFQHFFCIQWIGFKGTS